MLVFVKDLHKVENEFLRNGSPDFNSNVKKYGIGPAFRPDVAGWFNADPGNSRSSCALSVAISEFDCQGL